MVVAAARGVKRAVSRVSFVRRRDGGAARDGLPGEGRGARRKGRRGAEGGLEEARGLAVAKEGEASLRLGGRVVDPAGAAREELAERAAASATSPSATNEAAAGS